MHGTLSKPRDKKDALTSSLNGEKIKLSVFRLSQGGT
jgi:hypothetical protein